MNDEVKQLPPKDPMATFQERVVADMKSKIGEMLPDDALQELMRRAVNEEFFTPTKVDTNTGGWGSPRWEERPSWFVRELVKLAEPLIKEAVTKHVDEQRELIRTTINEHLENQNLTLLVFAAMRAEMFTLVQGMSNEMAQKLQQRGY